MFTIETTDQDYWIVLCDDLKTKKFEIIHVEEKAHFTSGRKIVKPFRSEEDAIKFIRQYVPYYAKHSNNSNPPLNPPDTLGDIPDASL